ncbi:MAG: hypothetical protein ACR2FV_10100 [Ornithinimicrobium sp.]|uniref:hypothetical protein n=1 Tax=Ornithinimicrobium sp. TaxID=1977084 RepID=UPI003D9AD76A
MIRTTRHAMATVVGLLALAGCAGTTGLGGGDWSVEASLAELPTPGETSYSVTTGDLDAAAEVSGMERPEAGERDALGEWLQPLTGPSPSLPAAPVLMVLPEVWQPSAELVQASEDELGWSILDASTYAELSAARLRFLVIEGDVDEQTPDDADLVDLGDGVFSAGQGADHALAPDDATSLRPTGAPLRMAVHGTRLALSGSTPAVESWLRRGDSTLGDDAALTDIAAALDSKDVVSAFLERSGFASDPAFLSRPAVAAVLGEPPISHAFDTVGMGWAVDDEGKAEVIVAYAFGDEGTAEASSPEVEQAFTAAVSTETMRPMSDRVRVEDITVDGRLVVATLTMVEGSPGMVHHLLLNRDRPFTHQ